MNQAIQVFQAKRTKKAANQLIGGLSKPGKMPGSAWSISAELCHTGSKLRQIPGSTCSACYALKGRYVFPGTKNAHSVRLAAFQNLPRNVWIDAIVVAIGKDKHFRWFDAGDLQGVDMLDAIATVARKTPNCQHWLPTREKKIVSQWVKQGNTIPDNLTIRVSAPMIDGSVPKSLPEGIKSSTVHIKTVGVGHICPANQQGNQCGDCRACWDKNVENVSYPAH